MDKYRVLDVIQYDINGVTKVLLPDDKIILIDTFKGGVSHSGHCQMSYSKFILEGSREVFKIYHTNYKKIAQEKV